MASADVDLLPTDLTWVTALVLDLADPWLVPAGVGRRETGVCQRYPQCSGLDPMSDAGCSPAVAPWCAVVVVSDPAGDAPQRPAGVDVA